MKKTLARIVCLSLIISISIGYATSPTNRILADSATRADIASRLFGIPLDQIDHLLIGANYDYNIFGLGPSDVCGNQGGHSGIDFQTKDVAGELTADRTFFAASKGVIVRAGDGDFHTISVWDEGADISVLYLHARSISSNVFLGAEIQVGDELGIQGFEGVSPAEHVHLEVRSGRQTRGSCGALDSLDPELHIPQYLDAVRIEPSRGPSGSLVTVIGEGFRSFQSVELLEIGGLDALGGRLVNTDASGNFTISDVVVPTLDPGIHAVKVEVGTGASRTSSSTSFEVLEEGPSEDSVVAEQLAPLGETLVRIWNFNNNTKTWSVYDPAALELSDLPVLVHGGVYWVKVTEEITAILDGVELTLTCTNPGTPEEDCWNLIVWLVG